MDALSVLLPRRSAAVGRTRGQQQWVEQGEMVVFLLALFWLKKEIFIAHLSSPVSSQQLLQNIRNSVFRINFALSLIFTTFKYISTTSPPR